MFLCSVKGGNPSTMFFSPHSCRGLAKHLQPESFVLGRDGKAGVLAVLRDQFGEALPETTSLTPESEPFQSEVCTLQRSSIFQALYG